MDDIKVTYAIPSEADVVADALFSYATKISLRRSDVLERKKLEDDLYVKAALELADKRYSAIESLIWKLHTQVSRDLILDFRNDEQRRAALEQTQKELEDAVHP